MKTQLTGLHFGLRVHPGADSENIYDRLYIRKERAFVKLQREIYNTDPRLLLGRGNLVPSERTFNVEDIPEVKTVVIHMSEKQLRHIETLIEKYDCRPPFDVERCKQDFHANIEAQACYYKDQLPSEIYERISDIRLLALGYCTSEIYAAIKKFSLENKKQTEQVVEELVRIMNAQNITLSTGQSFNFHDCRVMHLEQHNENQYIVHLDPSGGFTENNKVTFVDAKVIKEEPNIVGASWIYDEIYATRNGYEVHILFHGSTLSELIVQCKDILIEKAVF